VSDKKHVGYFPIRQNNYFKLLVNSSQFYPAILNAINNAQSEIIIENYLTHSGKVFTEFILALLQAAKRNVKVYCLFDGYGSKGISNNDLTLLSTNNIQVQFYNQLNYNKLLRNLFRDHRKLFIIDRQHTFIGGAGLSDQFDTNNKHAWHDIMLSIKGDIVQDWFLLFKKNWEELNKTKVDNIITVNNNPITTIKLNQVGKVIAYSAQHRKEIKKHLLHEIHKSKSNIWLTTPYFIPSRKLRRSLIKASKQGVDVKLLLPGKITDHPGVRIMGQRYYAQLLRHGIRIFEFSTHFSHAKVLLCDQSGSDPLPVS